MTPEIQNASNELVRSAVNVDMLMGIIGKEIRNILAQNDIFAKRVSELEKQIAEVKK